MEKVALSLKLFNFKVTFLLQIQTTDCNYANHFLAKKNNDTYVAAEKRINL